MKAFHGDPEIKAKYLARIRTHAAADAFALRLLAEGFLTANCATGEVFGSRWAARSVRGTKNTKGYRVFTARGFGERHQLKVHRVMWLASGQDIPDGLVIDHINRCKDDNRLANLRLADTILNAANRRSYKGEQNPSARISQIDVERVRDLSRCGLSYGKIAKHILVSKSLVAQIVRGEIWC
jgi:hypothetical protein